MYKVLKWESGVHRVQRVPVTETMGRLHTSTASVVVLPEAENTDIDFREEDVRVDVYRASGAGGQHVNKTESAVRVTHVPTGITVAMQDDRSQHRNREKAFKILRARLLDLKMEQIAKSRSSLRMQQIGRAERSERVRTFNFPDDRITDHRCSFSMFGIEAMLQGELLSDLADHLDSWHSSRRFSDFIQQYSSHASAKAHALHKRS